MQAVYCFFKTLTLLSFVQENVSEAFVRQLALDVAVKLAIIKQSFVGKILQVDVDNLLLSDAFA